jgi:hypothetical protein
MTRNIGRVIVQITTALLISPHLCAQMNYLLSWVPSNGSSSFGPYTSSTGYMNMWQDGECINYAQLQASVTESWACGGSAVARVSGSAGLTFAYDSYLCADVPYGVIASGAVQSPPGTIVNNELGEQDCGGYRFSTGGPHPWPCGTGNAPQP